LRLSQETPHALLLGGRRSGKTTALQSMLIGLARCYSAEQIRLIVVDPRRSLRTLSTLPHTECYAGAEADIQAVVERLQQAIDQPGAGEQRWIVAVDDYDIGYRQMEGQFRSSYDQDTNLFSVLKRLAAESEGSGPHLLIAANVKYAEEAGDVIKTLDAARNGLILWPHKYDGGTRLLDVGLPLGDRDADLPPGRALLVREDSSVLVQVAAVPRAEIEQVVTNIR
jgi:DNA segregation ATPase FtsK/SpoIIIE, S-DNA-T family